MTGGSIQQRFEDHARRAPERTALVLDGKTVTYGELDRDANQLAAHLAENGELPRGGGRVAICLEHPEDALTAMLAVLKAGHAYAVIAPGTPAEELHRQLGLAKADTVLTQWSLLARVDDGQGRTTLSLDTEAEAIAAMPNTPPRRRSSSGAATVLFTAGTTGRPTAVTSDHQRWTAAYEAWQEVYRLTPEDRILVTAPPQSTEFSGGWIRALGTGAVLQLSRRWEAAAEATVAECDPAAARLLLAEERPRLRLVLVAGEPLSLAEHRRLGERLSAPGARLLSVYGPAQVAGCGTWFEPEQLTVPVARPEGTVYLGRPFPGCAAELAYGHIRLTGPGGGVPVRTGDLGRRDRDGLLEFQGRAADRVSVLGRMVDTYRIESHLAADQDIKEVVVTGDGGAKGTGLLAFVVLHPGGLVDTDILRVRLQGLVPGKDIPRAVVPLTALPRTAAGKVDRRALPLPPVRGAVSSGGKGWGTLSEGSEAGAIGGAVGFCAAVLSLSLTGVVFPGATDLTGVPGPWSGLFVLLYLCESLAFGVGMAFLAVGRGPMARRSERPVLTTFAHLALVWLLVSWWPQDNLYRLAAKTDWPRQATLVYVFNVPLMIAALVVAVWAATSSSTISKSVRGS
ncbi:amino acid adenylation domain-containing protein [Streptomyces albus]|uniref:Amino acid adenylation domain-containing protein n=1 Tax=Streptomyces albus (strain ATCC 21838 / DSM 41398 / FERM P-419 / JCM 4703 / NBRC 107858) TaxID=1081613 RepID=A0A0B5EL29_STRA4|nr:amino acid adenylation domain-containing protein [Streptomyces albus]AOU76546.1 amino acid adenylation domain-containing protein [Streptomyces albus]AYN32329.1 hypothetical protein DUI70_1826 [Streptomyces albus]